MQAGPSALAVRRAGVLSAQHPGSPQTPSPSAAGVGKVPGPVDNRDEGWESEDNFVSSHQKIPASSLLFKTQHCLMSGRRECKIHLVGLLSLCVSFSSYMGGGRLNTDTQTLWTHPGWIIKAETTEGQGGALRMRY